MEVFVNVLSRWALLKVYHRSFDKNAPLKDPIKYKVLGYEISLRRQEAEMIEIISEQEAAEQAQGQESYHQSISENIYPGKRQQSGLVVSEEQSM